MKTLVLSLRGPWRSWGGLSIGDDRWTTTRPTASAALGLLGACAGIDRHTPELVEAWYRSWSVITASAKRWQLGRQIIDATLTSDYQTAHNSMKMDGSPNKEAVVSRRGYLEGAREVVAITLNPDADSALYDLAVRGLKSPVYPPFLGRRSNPLSEPPMRPDGHFDAADITQVMRALISRLNSAGLMEPSIQIQELEITADAGLLDAWRSSLLTPPTTWTRQGVQDHRSSARSFQYAVREIDIMRLQMSPELLTAIGREEGVAA